MHTSSGVRGLREGGRMVAHGDVFECVTLLHYQIAGQPNLLSPSKGFLDVISPRAPCSPHGGLITP